MKRATAIFVFFIHLTSLQAWAQSESWSKLDERATNLFNEQNYEESLEIIGVRLY